MLTGTLFDAALLAAEHEMTAFHPVNHGGGADFYRQDLLAPLTAAIADLEVRPDIRIRGTFEGGDWLATTGHLAGRFVAPLFGIPATGRTTFVRFGRFDRLRPGAGVGEPGSIVETLLIIDLPALMVEAGCWPLGPPLGPSPVAAGPLGHDGLLPGDDIELGRQSLKLVEDMIAGLKRFDGKNLATTDMRKTWTDDFWWYGPVPIGTFQGLAAYEVGHQGPFLRAFPDRVGGNHRARIAQGRFVASTGWPSMTATHLGGDWLGLAPTGRPITMRIMDWWACVGGRLSENWVMIDIPELLLQMDVDLFARMAVLARR